MELLSLLLFLCILLCAIKDWHKALLFWAPASILFQPYMCIRYQSPALSLTLAVQVLFVSLYVVHGRKAKFDSFPLKSAFILLFLSHTIGLFVSPMSTASLLPWLFSNLLSYIFVVFYFNELKTKSDIMLSLNGLLSAFFILSAYFLFEFVTQGNPLISYLFDLLPFENGWVYYSPEERFGTIRCQSLMSICISWGSFGAIMLWMIDAINNTNRIRINNLLRLYIFVISLMAVITSGARSAMMFACLFVLSYVFNYKGKYKNIFRVGIVILAFFSIGLLTSLFTTIFDDSISGSSFEQRQLQFAAAFAVIQNAPIFGFGIKGLQSIRLMGIDDLLGAESIWLQQLVFYGLFGILSQIILYYSCYRYAKLQNSRDKSAIFMLIGWIVFSTMTSSPGLSEAYFIMIFFLLNKVNSIGYVGATVN